MWLDPEERSESSGVRNTNSNPQPNRCMANACNAAVAARFKRTISERFDKLSPIENLLSELK